MIGLGPLSSLPPTSSKWACRAGSTTCKETPSASQTECQCHITRAMGSHLGRVPQHPVGPRRLRHKMAQCSVQHPAFVLENISYHSLLSLLLDVAMGLSACRLQQTCTWGLHLPSAGPSLHTQVHEPPLPRVSVPYRWEKRLCLGVRI